jgi:hypothetical protein
MGIPFIAPAAWRASGGVFRNAPNPNAARLFQSFLFRCKAQQFLVDNGALYSFHALVKERPGRTPLSEIKRMKSNPEVVEAHTAARRAIARFLERDVSPRWAAAGVNNWQTAFARFDPIAHIANASRAYVQSCACNRREARRAYRGELRSISRVA